MSPNWPPMGTRALMLFIEISADPASCPKFEREYHARNRVTRSVSPHRIRPTQASQAVSSIAVISEKISNDRAGELGSIPTALPKRLVRCSDMITRIPCREEVRASRPRLLGGRQVEITSEEIAGRRVVVALVPHALEHER